MSGTKSGLSSSSDKDKPESSESPKNAFVLEKDMKKAFTLSMKACELNNFYACANLSRMYAIGDGTEKNAEKSELYRKKSEELHDDFNRRRILAQFNHP